jgi:hypothetical protein
VASWTYVNAAPPIAIGETSRPVRHDDRFLNELIGELTVRSPIFAQLWADHNVRHHTTGKKTLHHPLVGELTVTYESMQTGDSGHSLVTYTAEPGSPSADALALLASWTAGGHREEGQSDPRTHGTQPRKPGAVSTV